MVYRILKHESVNVISERVETQTSLCGCSRYFWFTICSWDRRGREKKAAWFKVFSLYSWHLQVFSLQKTSRCLWNLMLYFQQEIKFLFEIWRNTVHTVFYQTSFQLSCPCLSWVSQFVFWVYWDDFLYFFGQFLGFFGHFKTVLIQQALGSK